MYFIINQNESIFLNFIANIVILNVSKLITVLIFVINYNNKKSKKKKTFGKNINARSQAMFQRNSGML